MCDARSYITHVHGCITGEIIVKNVFSKNLTIIMSNFNGVMHSHQTQKIVSYAKGLLMPHNGLFAFPEISRPKAL